MISLPNELIMQIIQSTERQALFQYLFVCKYTFQLVRQRVYRKVIFPDNQDIKEQHVLSFCQLYGSSIETMKLPQGHSYSDYFYEQILKLCPKLDYLQSSIYPKQIKKLNSIIRPSTCFMTTEIPVDLMTEEDLDVFHGTITNNTITYFPCCPSFFIFPTELVSDTQKEEVEEEEEEDKATLTQISHYFHHPGALSNAILPTFGSDLLALTLNPYDVLTASTARLIVSKCPRLRYLVVPSVKAEGLWMLLRWCNTLAAIIVGEEEEEQEEQEEWGDPFMPRRQNAQIIPPTSPATIAATTRARLLLDIENEKAVETIRNHKRVWCVHSSGNKGTLWHIGITPKN